MHTWRKLCVPALHCIITCRSLSIYKSTINDSCHFVLSYNGQENINSCNFVLSYNGQGNINSCNFVLSYNGQGNINIATGEDII